MSTAEMMKFWLIKETMPVLIGVGLVIVAFCVAFVWFWIQDVVKHFQRKRANPKLHRLDAGGPPRASSSCGSDC